MSLVLNQEWTKATAENPSEEVKESSPQVEEEMELFEEVSEEITENNELSKKVGKVNEKVETSAIT